MNPPSRRDDPLRLGIALGSNEGDRLRNLQAARTLLMALPQVVAAGPAPAFCAPVFETAPVGCAPGTAAFLNTALEIPCTTPFSPSAMLTALKGIEAALGRPSRHPRNAPRTVDLDLLYAGDIRCDLPDLTLPHPRLAHRRFVLAPLAVIRPDLVFPGQTRPVSELLAALPAQQEEVTLYASQW